MSQDKLLKRIALTPEQQKSFQRMKRAFNDCKKAGVRFEMSHETLIALNGKNVNSVFESTPSDDNHLEIQACEAYSIQMNVCPYVDCEVTVEVKV